VYDVWHSKQQDGTPIIHTGQLYWLSSWNRHQRLMGSHSPFKNWISNGCTDINKQRKNMHKLAITHLTTHYHNKKVNGNINMNSTKAGLVKSRS